MANQGSSVRVGEWLAAHDPASSKLDPSRRGFERLKRQHGLQVALDVIAHVQNVPLRLLRLDRLIHLDQTLAEYVRRWKPDVLRLFKDKPPDGSPRSPRPLSAAEAEQLWRDMQEATYLKALRKWVLDLGDEKVPETPELMRRPSELPPHYAEWFLMLMPHLERDVWLTEMSNPLPAHNLARMIEHCSMFILMWCWRESGKFLHDVCKLAHVSETEYEAHYSEAAADTAPLGLDSAADPFAAVDIGPGDFDVQRALGLEHLGLCILPAFVRPRPPRNLAIGLVAGPFLRIADVDADPREWFVKPLQSYLHRTERVLGVEGWHELRDKAPGATALHYALESRAGIDDYEAKRRALQSRSALNKLLQARLDRSVFGDPASAHARPISRANWETMAVLSAWYDRWGTAVFEQSSDTPLTIPIRGHRIKMMVAREQPLLFYAGDSVVSREAPMTSDDLERSLEQARATKDWRWIEGPDTFFARMRERQQAAWTVHVAAVGDLLARHSRRDRPEGADEPGSLNRAEPSCEEVDHLLRGFGGRVCRYLLSMARADVAEVYWLDYSSDPPRLRHVASAERLIEHRARRQALLNDFTRRTWKRVVDNDVSRDEASADLGPKSEWLLYRAANLGRTLPTAEERRFDPGAIGQPAAPRLDNFPNEARPEDAIAVPLLFNDRVVGVVGLAGMNGARHFDRRLYPVLRVVAQMLAQTMYFQSQVWHMRQLNWLASQVPLEQWRKHDRDNNFNPLRRVATCLANIFLCPGVQIWLRDEQNNPERYELHGNTAPEIFLEEGAPPEHAPYLEVGATAPRAEQPLSRSLIAFAIDQYTEAAVAVATTGEGTAESSAQNNQGLFVQALYVGGEERTTDYGVAGAQRGDLLLHADFLEASRTPNADADDLPTLRKALFERRGWSQTAAFALLRFKGRRADVVGVVGLHAGGRSPDERAGTSVHRPPWPPGWRPVVAHMQTYLPYLLMQTEAIANPLDDMRRYLLHEGRNELNAVSEQASSLKTALGRVLDIDALGSEFRARPWLRQTKERLETDDSLRARDLLDGLSKLDSSLEDVADKVQRLMSVERGENIAMLGELIDRQRDFAALGVSFRSGGRFHDIRWINLRDVLEQQFAFYESNWRAIPVWYDVDKVPDNIEMLTQPRLWMWLVGDLVHNIVKYANANSSAEASLTPPPTPSTKNARWRLRLRDESSYDPGVDIPTRLVQHGVQGSAGRLMARRLVLPSARVNRHGQGIGLWGVQLLSEVLGLDFRIEIHARRNPKEANYFFDLLIPSHLVRRSGRAN